MSFLNKLLGKKASADSAKERLQLVLIHDRTNLTPSELESLRDDLVATISRHIEIDAASMVFGLEHDGRSQRLIADIPIKRVPRSRAKGKSKAR
jgi:cell division topological specificity factor